MSKLFSSFPGSLFCHGNALRDSFGGMNEGMRVYKTEGLDSGKGALDQAPSVGGGRKRMGELLFEGGRKLALGAALALGLGSTVACNDDDTTDIGGGEYPEEDGDTTGGTGGEMGTEETGSDGTTSTNTSGDTTDSGTDTSGDTTDTSGDTTGTGEEFPAPPEVLIDTLDWGCDETGCAANGVADEQNPDNPNIDPYTARVEANFMDLNKTVVTLSKLDPKALGSEPEIIAVTLEDGVLCIEYRSSNISQTHILEITSENNMGPLEGAVSAQKDFL